ncbi:MAG: hypothetical protein SLAVMIC_00521 [uncultured marine phage]|uniref:Uncharacterized protein n=1 Tax=uncultured marine phage TaxID=707152 RepID=A0A8D9CEC3_9VIRU|nr:MAG: hypothetical protein SLAVMIC_00521 [uncultured marine phage]
MRQIFTTIFQGEINGQLMNTIQTYNTFLEMSSIKRKIGIDIHGVINVNPDIFSALTKKFKDLGYEIHVLTGPRLNQPYKTRTGNYNSVEEELVRHDIIYDHLFSVLDYNIEQGEDAWEDEKGWWTSDESWNKTKAEYCQREQIDFHIDDTKIYGKFFTTPFAHLTPPADVRKLELHGISEDDEIIQIIKSVAGDKFIYEKMD